LREHPSVCWNPLIPALSETLLTFGLLKAKDDPAELYSGGSFVLVNRNQLVAFFLASFAVQYAGAEAPVGDLRISERLDPPLTRAVTVALAEWIKQYMATIRSVTCSETIVRTAGPKTLDTLHGTAAVTVTGDDTVLDLSRNGWGGALFSRPATYWRA
jgi:hypothetical protein